MKSSLRKMLCLALTIAMVGSSLIGCGTAKSTEVTTDPSVQSTAPASASGTVAEKKADISKKVEVVMYLAGDATPDSPLVEAEMNKIFEKDLNCTIKTINIPWADWDTKYPLILTAGEKYDLIYASNWTEFASYAYKGAFKELDGLLETYAPGLLKQLPKEAWEEVTVNGKIFGLPSKQNSYNTDGICIRGDMREAMGLPLVTNLDTLEVYLEGVKKNYPDIIPFNACNLDRPMFFPTTAYEPVGGDDLGLMSTSYENLDKGDVNLYPFMDGYDKYVQRMKVWSDKGYFPKGLLTSTVLSVDSFKTGKSAVAVGNTGAIILDAIANTVQMHPEWKPEFVELRYELKKGIHKMPYMADGMAVGRNAENPERALMVCDKIRTEQESYNLLMYGIKDRNYAITADGLRTDPPGVTPEKNGYVAQNQGQWGFTVADMDIASVNDWPDRLKVIFPEFDKISTPDKMARFALNRDTITSEIATVTQIQQQYNLPLLWGKSKDPVKDLETLKTKLKAAGSDKILAEVKAQMLKYFSK